LLPPPSSPCLPSDNSRLASGSPPSALIYRCHIRQPSRTPGPRVLISLHASSAVLSLPHPPSSIVPLPLTAPPPSLLSSLGVTPSPPRPFRDRPRPRLFLKRRWCQCLLPHRIWGFEDSIMLPVPCRTCSLAMRIHGGRQESVVLQLTVMSPSCLEHWRLVLLRDTPKLVPNSLHLLTPLEGSAFRCLLKAPSLSAS
jgi:hypothetical protein